MSEKNVDIYVEAGGDHCSVAFFSSKHWCDARILVLNLTFFEPEELTCRCCGLTVTVIALLHKRDLTTSNQSACLTRGTWQNHQSKSSLEFMPFLEEVFPLLTPLFKLQ